MGDGTAELALVSLAHSISSVLCSHTVLRTPRAGEQWVTWLSGENPKSLEAVLPKSVVILASWHICSHHSSFGC